MPGIVCPLDLSSLSQGVTAGALTLEPQKGRGKSREADSLPGLGRKIDLNKKQKGILVVNISGCHGIIILYICMFDVLKNIYFYIYTEFLFVAHFCV